MLIGVDGLLEKFLADMPYLGVRSWVPLSRSLPISLINMFRLLIFDVAKVLRILRFTVQNFMLSGTHCFLVLWYVSVSRYGGCHGCFPRCIHSKVKLLAVGN